MSAAVIGIGQVVRGDDAAGLEAVRLWRLEHTSTATRDDVQVRFADDAGVGLLDLLDGADRAVLVDAMQSGAMAGTVRRLSEAELEGITPGTTSAHGWGLAEALRLGRTVKKAFPPLGRIRIVGIEAAQMEVGLGLSPEVKLALPMASNCIEEVIRSVLQD